MAYLDPSSFAPDSPLARMTPEQWAQANQTRRYAYGTGGVPSGDWVMPQYGPPVAAPPSTMAMTPTGVYGPPPTDYFPDLSGVGQILYGQQPKAAFTRYRQQVAPDPNSPLAKYLEGLYPDIFQGDYTTANLNEPGLTFADFLNQRGAGYAGGFGAQSAAQRGEHPLQFSRWLA